MKTFKTRTVHFVFSLRIFVSAPICCYLAARLFRNFTFNYRKKARERSRKRLDIVQFGGWRDSFSSALCSILSYKMFREIGAPWLVRTISLYFHNARALRHTSVLVRYNAHSLSHRYVRAQFTIHFSIGNHMISSAIRNK